MQSFRLREALFEVATNQEGRLGPGWQTRGIYYRLTFALRLACYHVRGGGVFQAGQDRAFGFRSRPLWGYPRGM